MELEFFQVDAFADIVFEGNSAAVYPLDAWLPDATLQAIAAEHNLSETVFFVPTDDGYHIRWFTPVAEVALCGHATLACAHVVFNELASDGNCVRYSSLSGPLSVRRDNGLLTLDFPAVSLESVEAPAGLAEGLGANAVEVLRCEDYIVVLGSEAEVANLKPNMLELAKIECRGICVTAPGETVDFVSRFFAPRYGIDEDPVTGSAHCALTPYWSQRLNKTTLDARQLSKRGGRLRCRNQGDRVEISGRAVTYSRGRAFPQRT